MKDYCFRCGHHRLLDIFSRWCKTCMEAAGYGFNPPLTEGG